MVATRCPIALLLHPSGSTLSTGCAAGPLAPAVGGSHGRAEKTRSSGGRAAPTQRLYPPRLH